MFDDWLRADAKQSGSWADGLMLKPMVLGMFLGIGLLASGQTVAEPPHKTAVLRHYGDLLPARLRDCYLCHLTDDEISEAPPGTIDDEPQPWNAFGRSLYELGHQQVEAGADWPAEILDRLQSLVDEDADGDGVTNELELLCGTSPGRAEERPNDEQIAVARGRLEIFRRSQDYPWRPFEPVVRPEIPTAENATWVATPIDAFVAAEHHRHGLAPRPAASREVLLRRLHLDLIGLPPTAEELQEFLADESPDAYAQVVDRLLDSPRYGERWGRHWMDIWRYSDWAGWGDQVRDSHPHIWRWRDWIIDSLNDDKPYDRMVLEMLAADEAAPGDPEALRATGYLVRNYKRLSREQWMSETVDHAGRAFLAVTYKCAQCHDHLYDPLRQEEYFQFRAIFEPYQVRIDPLSEELNPQKAGVSRVYESDPEAQTVFYERGDERLPDPSRKIVPGVPAYLGGGPLDAEPVSLPYEAYYPDLRPAVLDARRRSLRSEIEARKSALEQAAADHADADAALVLAQSRFEAATAELAALEARIAAEQAKYGVVPSSSEEIQQLASRASQHERQAKLAAAEVQALEAQQALEAAERQAGDEDKRRQAVQEARNKAEEATKARDAAAAAVVAESDKYSALGTVYPQTSSGRRLKLARWITNRQNPLAARVAVNHLWARRFGQGLVKTVDDFGRNGGTPALPALLDWLAVELMEPTQLQLAKEPPKPWSMKHLHRLMVLSNTYRMDSRYDADNAQIDPENRLLWRMTPRRVEAEVVRDSVLHVAGSLDLQMGGPELDHHQVLTVPRRSIYFRHAPEKQPQFLQIFDMAAPSECYQRRDSVIPQQALALANSELAIKQSRRLARRLDAELGAADREFIRAAFLQVLSRAPTDPERSECETFLAEQSATFAKSAESSQATDNMAERLSDLAQPAAEPALRARENLIHVLLNHHEFVMLP